jgi:molybdate transport system substrate-binding protein
MHPSWLVTRRWLPWFAVALAGCGADRPGFPAAEPLRIFAAASTAEWIEALIRTGAIEAAQPTFGATSDLARQIAAGAPADVLVAASPLWPQHLGELGVTNGPARLVARNRLALATQASSALASRPPAELADLLAGLGPDQQVGVAVEGVPAGDYARAAIASLGLAQLLAPRLVGFSDVRAVHRAVERGEIAVGFVYASDLRDPALRLLVAVDPGLHPPIEYLAVSVASDERAERAQVFLDLLASAQARACLIELGFEPGS